MAGWRPALLACAGIFFILSGSAAASDQRFTPIVKAAQKSKPSVVSIRGEKTVLPGPQTGANEAPKRVNGMGTGVVIDPRGYILTNYHVVDGVREIQVTPAGSKKYYVGSIVARDAETDLAVIKITPTEKLEVISIGTSSDLMQGETVVAVGNAFGYDFTVTRGIVSALHRAVQINDAQYYDDLIQTDAPINPGNSGGPLLNIDGEMVGVNVAVRAGAQGIGFAIPIDKAVNIAATLLASSAKSWHGLVAAPDAPASLSGVKVETIEKKSPAAEAGLKAGDVITAIAGTEIHRALDFQREMLDRKAGDKVEITVRRDGKSRNLDLVLGESPDSSSTASVGAWETLGLELRAMPGADFKQKFHTRYRGGLLVVDVRQNSPAAEQGIRTGDVLVGMHVWETVSLDNVAYILKRPDFNSITPVKFFILRGNETLYGFMPVSLKVARQP